MSQPSWYDSARLLAQLKGETSPNQGMLKRELENQNVDNSKNSHMITVSETGEASLLPDVAKVFVTYKSIKVCCMRYHLFMIFALFNLLLVRNSSLL